MACRILAPARAEPRPIAVKAWRSTTRPPRTSLVCVSDICHSVTTVVVYPYLLLNVFSLFVVPVDQQNFLVFNVVTFINFG